MPLKGGGQKVLDTIVGRLHTKRGETARGMERGLVKAGLFLQRESQKVVPVDTGTLTNSAFTRKTGSGFETEVKVGYTAEYAIFVHEDLDARHEGRLRRRRGGKYVWVNVPPGKYAKFLETPAYGFREEMVKIIRHEAKKG